MKEWLRQIPPVHEIQRHPQILNVEEELGVSREKVTSWIKETLDQIRADLLRNQLTIDRATDFMDYVVQRVYEKSQDWKQYSLTEVINATGTILHTNLGRARLSDEAIQHVVEVAQNYSNLEYKILEGKRGSRHNIVEELIKEVTGAEAALVVNNNASAVYLTLRGLAKGKEVIVSRGELVEIGGSFRVSSIMEESDATLVEVGTTNKTHDYDYKSAINEDTAMIMKVHTSNFKVVGFTESVDKDILVPLANKHNITYYEDLGSGALIDYGESGIGDEPVVKEVLDKGAHLVSFSGDKLLGGPQAGIIAGKKHLIDHLKKHQLARVLRVDKMTLAALESTLKAYAKGTKSALHSIPTTRDIVKNVSEIKAQIMSFLERAEGLSLFSFQVQSSFSTIGGGTMPNEQLETYGVTVNCYKMTPSQLERQLRKLSTPVIGRFLNDQVFFDFRTLTPRDIDCLYNQLLELNQKLEVM
ncbi:L-seryl-tRNA(Sec) selenium transferase [Salinibacillus xinjiangensis]|uniref:L-seryl-tRNA(Sec) selenium transferase n=1 Tax=Salinibacillus xinjiangensis TaxID=1229268 RepID=A0A6G1X2T9_9BACI|nr:L-seryl-tRNA(Sec) selenium transferase [Salinibacillus xinjiangensis]MRG85291.1 L-seryl-tRNA(Sec) selenium transferase [Salinibacillus xinjiangensis]